MNLLPRQLFIDLLKNQIDMTSNISSKGNYFFTIVFPLHTPTPQTILVHNQVFISHLEGETTTTLQTMMTRVQHLAWKERQWGKNPLKIFRGKAIAGIPFCLQLPDMGQAYISDFTSRKLVLSSSTTLLLYVKPSLINIFSTDIHCIKEFSRDVNLQSPAFISEINLQK